MDSTGTEAKIIDDLQAIVARSRLDADRLKLALAAGTIVGTWFWDVPADRFTVDEPFAEAFGLDPALGRDVLALVRLSAPSIPRTAPASSLPLMRRSRGEVVTPISTASAAPMANITGSRPTDTWSMMKAAGRQAFPA